MSKTVTVEDGTGTLKVEANVLDGELVDLASALVFKMQELHDSGRTTELSKHLTPHMQAMLDEMDGLKPTELLACADIIATSACERMAAGAHFKELGYSAHKLLDIWALAQNMRAGLCGLSAPYSGPEAPMDVAKVTRNESTDG
jgi:hypothetical protein